MQKIQVRILCHVPGKITGLHIPGGNGIRVDTSIYSDYEVPRVYDSMIAKIIVHGNNRNESNDGRRNKRNFVRI